MKFLFLFLIFKKNQNKEKVKKSNKMERHDRRHNIVNGKILQELRGKFLALKNPGKKATKTINILDDEFYTTSITV